MSQIRVRCALRINRYWFNFDGGRAAACAVFLPISHEQDRPDTLARWFPIRPRTCLHICLHVAYALHSIVLANCSFNLFIIGNIRLAACPALLKSRVGQAGGGMNASLIPATDVGVICDFGFIVCNRDALTSDWVDKACKRETLCFLCFWNVRWNELLVEINFLMGRNSVFS